MTGRTSYDAMPELAYRRSSQDKAHRRQGFAPWAACSCARLLRDMEPVPVEQVDPADLCKRCWPECGEVFYGDFDPRTIAADAIDFGIPRRCERRRGHDGEHSRWLGRT